MAESMQIPLGWWRLISGGEVISSWLIVRFYSRFPFRHASSHGDIYSPEHHQNRVPFFPLPLARLVRAESPNSPCSQLIDFKASPRLLW